MLTLNVSGNERVVNHACCSDPSVLCEACARELLGNNVETVPKKPEPMPFLDWELTFNQEASHQKQSVPQTTTQAVVSNSRNPEKPIPLGLPIYDYSNENFYQGN